MEKNSISINYEGLLKMGLGVIDARYSDYLVATESIKLVVVPITTERDSFYQDMIKIYCPVMHKPKDIHTIWTDVLEHKLKMSSLLKRDVSIRTAACDYFDTQGQKINYREE